VAGALLAPGRRTVTAALRVMDLERAPGFAVYHRLLSQGRWSSRAVAHRADQVTLNHRSKVVNLAGLMTFKNMG
jgi:hypothetical protein